MTFVFLLIIILELGIIIYLNFKRFPAETQKEILRKIEPLNTEIVDWIPPKDETEIAEEKAREKMGH